MKGGRWLVLGDFNFVTSQEEKINGRRVTNAETEDLRRRKFKYCNFWETLDGYSELVQSSWGQNYSTTMTIAKFQNTLKVVRYQLKMKFAFQTSGMEQRVQRSKVTWMKEGDTNSKYFHVILKSRRSRNKIRGVLLDNGEFSSNPHAIKEKFVNYYKDLLSGNEGICPIW
ncbi:hypothetical protein QQ045_033674 [Rhodiola kirilowii]